MNHVDVRVERIWKQYHLGARSDPHELFWALKDVSFEVTRGSSLGVIGANGAGKSTLMKLLARITAPTRGRMTIHGRLVALIEVGSGFHPELTGRENVFLSGAILGMRRRELAAKLASIIEFAGVERFIDTPVKWYSSGMYVRLGFSIAAHLEPDVLLIDEVLAVGDAEFQAKCLRRIRDLQRQGVTMIFISHDLTAVEQLCDRVLLLDHGGIVVQGDPPDVVAEYHRRVLSAGIDVNGESPSPVQGTVTVTNVTLRDPRPDPPLGFSTGAPLLVALRFAADREARVIFELSYYSPDGKTLLATTATDAPGGCAVAPPGGTVEFVCAAIPLRPGDYYITAVVRDASTRETVSWWDGGTTLHVEPGAISAGQFHMPHTWRLTQPRTPNS
jgi:ABC-type polysaccharide/polyol phosphate transport system ATPase subunit